ncbi:hypothetical protein GCM10023144_40330 [Pigmentiphaga soli]|uniref:SnoaL-like domain-containing protein n=1 Tax=Pigmentiphaga soli TaxID=1007095 RepID=A0ABP8HKS3_9BURK
MTTDTASASALRAELRDLYDDYAAALDDFDLPRWATFFTDDCHYRIVSLENFKEGLPISTVACRGIAMIHDRIAALGVTAVFEQRVVRHIVGGVRLLEAGSEIVSQGNFALFESQSDRESQLLLVGRYLDRIVRQGGALKFRERVCVYDNYRIRTSLVYPV